MKNHVKIMVFRFSAMGDVALVLAAFKTVQLKFPEVEFIFITREKFVPIFENQSNVRVIGVNFDDYKGVFGLFNLYKKLKKYQFEYVVDLHRNLRTAVLNIFFRFSEVKIFKYYKGRNEKKDFINGKKITKIPSTLERYLLPFERIFDTEFQLPSTLTNYFNFKGEDLIKVEAFLKHRAFPIIGIAPFAQHTTKMWPIEKYVDLSKKIQAKFPEYSILFFGGGQKEKQIIDKYLSQYGENIIGLFRLREELKIISQLDVMICGDSSNMHLANLAGIKVISIWGATHHKLGFGPTNQNIDNIIEIPKEKLECRPCSVYGNKPCHRGDLACLNQIKPETVFDKLAFLIK